MEDCLGQGPLLFVPLVSKSAAQSGMAAMAAAMCPKQERSSSCAVQAPH